MTTFVMDVQNFFNVRHNRTLLGGKVLNYVRVGDEVEIITAKSSRKVKLVEIKRFNQNLYSVCSGVAGFIFEGIGDMDFRTTPLPPNPYNPRVQSELEEYLRFSSKDNDAENVRIIKT